MAARSRRDRLLRSAVPPPSTRRRVEPASGICTRRRTLKETGRGIPRIDRFVGSPFERPPEAAVGSRSRGMRVGGRHLMLPHQHLRDLRGGQRSEPQPLTARSHRREEQVGTRRDENEDGCRRRLFERLEERVLRLRHERVRIIHDNDPSSSFERAISRSIDRIANLIDLDGSVVAGREVHDIRMHAARDPAARAALAAGVHPTRVRPLHRMFAIERLRERHGRGVFADAWGAGKNQAWRERPAADRARQQLEEVPVAHELAKRHTRHGTSLRSQLPKSQTPNSARGARFARNSQKAKLPTPQGWPFGS